MQTSNAPALLNAVIGKMQLKNDAALARALGLEPPVISKLRHGKIAVGATLLLRIYDVAGMSIEEQREICGAMAYQVTAYQRGQLRAAA